jgi:hypothetical protein
LPREYTLTRACSTNSNEYWAFMHTSKIYGFKFRGVN